MEPIDYGVHFTAPAPTSTLGTGEHVQRDSAA
jgi:hypothetical protein